MEPPARRGRPKEGAEAGRVISLVGPSNSGQTGLICRLVEHFRAKGLKVAVLKHSHKPILAQALEVRRYRVAAVSTVALAGPHLLHLNRSYPGEPPLAEILRLLAPAVDLVLVEGYKSDDLPKIALGGMIGGAALGAFFVGNSGKEIKATLKDLPKILKGSKYDKSSYMELMALLYELLSKVRKEGLMSIEGDVENPKESPMFTKIP